MKKYTFQNHTYVATEWEWPNRYNGDSVLIAFRNLPGGGILKYVESDSSWIDSLSTTIKDQS